MESTKNETYYVLNNSRKVKEIRKKVNGKFLIEYTDNQSFNYVSEKEFFNIPDGFFMEKA